MLKQIEGSHGIAEAVAMCRPEVICAYPITPQTHIVEDLGTMVKSGNLSKCEFINVESEFAALSVAIGSSAAGARSYTATASQGLLYMAEAVYNASGLGLPIVMTVGNRAIGAPINIWNDQSDSMSMRDAGWIQLFAETNQEALDLHIQAFRIAETLSIPVMVCVDGFILTHAFERIDIPEQAQVDQFLPPFEPRQVLDPDEPISLGAMVGPEAFTEVRYLAHHKQMQALELIPEIADDFKNIFGRDSGGLISSYRTEDAETLIVTLGSVIGTIADVIDSMRDAGHKIGAVTLRCYRPFPTAVLREALKDCQRVVVFEKCLAVGMGGIVASNVRMSTRGLTTPVYTVIGGLGGRPITCKSLKLLFEKAIQDELDEITFLDIKCDIVERELARERDHTRSGAAAENILREAGVVDAAKTA
ncbi:MAG: pyruvate ferredoxin oxidoreductase [Candidatus Thiodiazotropha sp. (ex Lucinoma borealis)]|nr:pyruvate ferredoxin oxidoreductase [Candidatus Thiodiazotropha sp. (ex Lucinoma borealis)]